MKRRSSILSLLIGGLLLISCKREKLMEIYPELEGNWKHYTASTNYHYLEIESNGDGEINWFEENKFTGGSETRKWFVKDGYLMLGRASAKFEKFKIDSLPQTASSTFIVGFDTVLVGEEYIWLDGGLYCEL